MAKTSRFLKWTGEASLDCEWLGGLLGRSLKSATAESMAGAGGLSGEMIRIRCVDVDGVESTVVSKTTRDGATSQSAQLGLDREARFYASCKLFDGLLPKVYLSVYEEGEKCIIMEDLSEGVQSGLYFGPGSPHNWKKDLSAYADATVERIATEAFKAAARIHGRFWGAEDDACRSEWVRGAGWLKGADREAWEASQAIGKGMWDKVRAGMAESDVKWDPEMVAIMDASIAAVSWDAFQSELKSRPLTLVHGDYHPANMMWMPNDKENPLRILDWEMVGVGSGAQDLGQYVISHMDPAQRQEMEERLLKAYVDELAAQGVANYTLETCRSEYAAGGVARWVWLLAYLAATCPAPMTQFFHDQVLAFARGNGVTAANVPQPRV